MLFLAKWTPGERWAKASKHGHGDVQFLEKMLIGQAVRRNPGVANVANTKMLRDMVVPGLLNTPNGRQGETVAYLRSLLDA